MATSHSSESRIRQLSLTSEGVWAVPVDGQNQLECIQKCRILSRYIEIEVVAVPGSRGPPPILGEQGHSLFSTWRRPSAAGYGDNLYLDIPRQDPALLDAFKLVLPIDWDRPDPFLGQGQLANA